MDIDGLDDVIFLGAVTVLSALQNVFFAYTVQNESVQKRPANTAFDRVSVASHNCIEVYPTFLALLWTAGLFCSQAPAAFAGLLYLVVRHKYFVGYLGENSQRLLCKGDFHRPRQLSTGQPNTSLGFFLENV
ncbi:arachidonate 5-lipoxygenase-activating protein isoform X2 [Narcine bancroftii]|uniref:arachidonate 5-lipoxygenase-activating protein isoform X2 n=1 Tax=Narcine bancroftii TaxID=1343680 RepID=UPI00383131D1